MFLTTLMGLNVISWGGNLAKRPKTKFQDPNVNGYDYDFFHLELYQSKYGDLPIKNRVVSKIDTM